MAADAQSTKRDASELTGSRRHDRVVFAAVFICAAIFFLYCWAVQPGRPPLNALNKPAVAGWYGGAADQINYAREARALARWELPGIHWDYERSQPRPDLPANVEVSDYAYGLGYPVLGVPFIWLGLKGDPFVVPDCVAFGAAACLIFAIGRRVFRDRTALLVTAAVVLATPMVNFFATPWNTTPTVLANLLALYIGVSGDRSWRAVFAFGIVASLAFSARYVDIVWIGAVIVPVVLLDLRRATRIIVGVLPVLLVTAGFMLWSQDRVFGNAFETPLHYHFHEGKRGDDLSDYVPADIPEHGIAVFVTSQKTNGQRSPTGYDPLLRNFFWLLAAPVGLLALARHYRFRSLFRKPCGTLVVAGIVSVLASAFYLSYWSGGGDDIMNQNGRFFVCWFPLWGILAAVGMAAIVQRIGARGYLMADRLDNSNKISD
jgi:hypothetical protein